MRGASWSSATGVPNSFHSIPRCWTSAAVMADSTRLIADKRPDISIRGIDVRQRKDAAMPVETFDGKSIPYAEGSFDIVMFVDVLHHAGQPMTLLREAVRVARQAILIKDHLVEGTFAYSTLRFMDWVGNARHGVALPYDYWTLAKWHRVLDDLGLNIDVLGIELEAISISGRSDFRAILALFRAAPNAR